MNWYYLSHPTKINDKAIIAISDTGEFMRKSGEIGVIPYRMRVSHNGNKVRAYRLIAEVFLQTVHSPEQDCIEHITHNPVNMNINDIRNLRWCTHKENLNFDEYKLNRSNVMKGKSTWNKGISGKEYLKHYKDGKVSNQYLKEV